MLTAIEHAATLVVGRDCALAGIGVFAYAIQTANEPRDALLKCGVLSLFVCAMFVLRAFRAVVYPYQRTDVWEMLSPRERPNGAFAQLLIGRTLRLTNLRFALHSAYASVGFLMTFLAIELFATCST